MTEPHVEIGGIPYRLDMQAPLITQRPPLRHWWRSPFTGRSDITGRPGAQNYYPERLQLQLTDYTGEGQVVLRGSDPDSAKRFFESEGLNMRVPGQFALNRSIRVQAPQATGTATTTEGSAMTDETGTSTVVNTTDRRLNATADVIETGNLAPGAVAVQADFHMYKEAQQLTSIDGSALSILDGPAATNGTTMRMRGDSRVRNASHLSVTADVIHDVHFFLHTTLNHYPYGWGVRVIINDVTGGLDNPVAVTTANLLIRNTSAPTDPSATLKFTPKSGRNYRAVIKSFPPQQIQVANSDYLVVNTIQYGRADQAATVTLIAYNETDTALVTSKQVQVTSTATAKVASLTFNGTAAKNYHYKVQYDSGRQKPVVDKVVQTVAAAAQFTFDALELGQGGNVWLAGSRSATDGQLWYYDFTTEAWVEGPALNASTTSGEAVIALAHTDQFEYALTSGGDILRATTAADVTHTAAITNTVSMCVAQGRLFVLKYDATNGIIMATYQLDSGTPAAELLNVTIGTAKPVNEQTYRQQMVGTPTGARFFINHSDVHAVIYEVDGTGTVLVAEELTVLPPGAKATAICHAEDTTFVAGQFIAETGETPISALWVIHPNGVPQRIGEFRDGNVNPPVFMQPFQNDIWILQGDRVWRYSLTTGGLFLEYQLNPKTQSTAKALAVLRGHIFVSYSDEGVFVAGADSTYRQSSITNGNSYTSSIYDFDLPGVNKELDSIVILTDELADATAVEVEVQTNQSGTWTSLGSSTLGSQHFFRLVSTSIEPLFQTLQLRVKLASQTGANTPVVKAIVVYAWAGEDEEFYDLVLRLDHEDSSDHPGGVQRTAAQLAANLTALKTARRPVEFTDVDGLTATVRIEDVDDQRDAVDDQGVPTGEGRAIVRLRVLT